MPYTLAGALVCLAGFSGQTRWLALFAGNPTESGAEVSATGYARLLRSSSQMTVTDNELSVSMGEWDDSTNASWGTPDHVAFMTAATGGTVLAYTKISPALSAAIAAGDRVFTEEGDIRMQIPIDEEDLEVVPTGMIAPFAGSSAPDGWLLTDGGAYSRTEYANLFAEIGTDYGEGNGSTTFNVPNTTGRFPLGAGDGRSLADTGGAATVTLSSDEMPSHTHNGPSHSHTIPSHSHTIPSHSHSYSAPSSHSHSLTQRTIQVQGGGTSYTVISVGATQAGHGSSASTTGSAGGGSTGSAGAGSTGTAGTNSTSAAGDGQAHENMPPFVVFNFMIKT